GRIDSAANLAAAILSGIMQLLQRDSKLDRLVQGSLEASGLGEDAVALNTGLSNASHPGQT
ncbi:hypothetical protein, partial [Heyndrickxia coagulans]|uniref:hypothetical protein n=1 Tax=Heyndrickxia coagulans TaxID=1398 RepID=UPI00214DAE2F